MTIVQTKLSAASTGTLYTTVSSLKKEVARRVADGVLRTGKADPVLIFDKSCTLDNLAALEWPDIFQSAQELLKKQLEILKQFKADPDSALISIGPVARAQWCLDTMELVSIAIDATNINPRFLFPQGTEDRTVGDVIYYGELSQPPADDFAYHRSYGRRATAYDMPASVVAFMQTWKSLATKEALGGSACKSSDSCPSYYYGPRYGQQLLPAAAAPTGTDLGNEVYIASLQGDNSPYRGDFDASGHPGYAFQKSLDVSGSTSWSSVTSKYNTYVSSTTVNDRWRDLFKDTPYSATATVAIEDPSKEETLRRAFFMSHGGLLAYCELWAKWVTGTTFANIVQDATFFYYNWHIPYFAARGLIDLSTRQVKEAADAAWKMRKDNFLKVSGTIAGASIALIAKANPVAAAIMTAIGALQGFLVSLWSNPTRTDFPQPLNRRSLQSLECSYDVSEAGGINRVTAAKQNIAAEAAASVNATASFESFVNSPIFNVVVGVVGLSVGVLLMKMKYKK